MRFTITTCPAGADDAIPRSRVGLARSSQSRISWTRLGGFFRAGMMPSGSRDPVCTTARRLRDCPHSDRRRSCTLSRRCGFVEISEARVNQRQAIWREFFVDRLRYYLRDVRGYRYDEVNAVIAASPDVPLDAATRDRGDFPKVRPTPDFEPLAVSFKRIENILQESGRHVESFTAQTDGRSRSCLRTGGRSRSVRRRSRALRSKP